MKTFIFEGEVYFNEVGADGPDGKTRRIHVSANGLRAAWREAAISMIDELSPEGLCEYEFRLTFVSWDADALAEARAANG